MKSVQSQERKVGWGLASGLLPRGDPWCGDTWVLLGIQLPGKILCSSLTQKEQHHPPAGDQVMGQEWSPIPQMMGYQDPKDLHSKGLGKGAPVAIEIEFMTNLIRKDSILFDLISKK